MTAYPEARHKLAKARREAVRKLAMCDHIIYSMIPVARPGLGAVLGVDQYYRLYYDPAVVLERPLEDVVFGICHEAAHLLCNHVRRGRQLVDAVNHPEDWKTWDDATNATVNHLLYEAGLRGDPSVKRVDHKSLGLPGNQSAERNYRELKARRDQALQDAENQQGDGATDKGENVGSDNQTGDTPGDDSEAGEGSDSFSGSSGEAGDQDQRPEQGDQVAQGGDQGSEGGSPGQQDQPGSQAGESEGQQQGSGSSAGSGDQGSEESPGSPGGTEGLGDGEPWDGEPQVDGSAGSCSDGQRRPWELPPPTHDEGEGNGDQDVPGVHEHDHEQLTKQAAEKAKSMGIGNEPGSGWATAVDEILNPKVDPTKLLNRIMAKQLQDLNKTGSGRYSYRRPGRRPGLGGLIRPSTWQPTPNVVVLIDTSGSMNAKDLGNALGIVRRCLSQLRMIEGIKIVAGDTHIRWSERVTDPRQIQLKGRGGTSMERIMPKLVDDKVKPRDKPELLITITDGETMWPSEKEMRGVPCTAVLTRNPTYYKVPDFMTSVCLED